MKFSLIGLLAMIIMIINSGDARLNKQVDCKCRTPVKSRIVNGDNAQSGSWPWQLSIQAIDKSDYLPSGLRRLVPNKYKIERHRCGAVLLNDRWALTAAHCIPDTPISKTSLIGFGSNDLVEMFDKNHYVEIDHAYVHPEYRNNSLNSPDLALIRFKKPIEFNDNVQPACLPENEKIYRGVLTMTGFGAIEVHLFNAFDEIIKKHPPSRYLQEARTADYSVEMCSGYLDNYICVDNQATNESACKGDSGGPLHYVKNGRTQVIGVTSIAFPVIKSSDIYEICAGPAAYARVSTHMDWIRRHIGDEYCFSTQ